MEKDEDEGGRERATAKGGKHEGRQYPLRKEEDMDKAHGKVGNMENRENRIKSYEMPMVKASDSDQGVRCQGGLEGGISYNHTATCVSASLCVSHHFPERKSETADQMKWEKKCRFLRQDLPEAVCSHFSTFPQWPLANDEKSAFPAASRHTGHANASPLEGLRESACKKS